MDELNSNIIVIDIKEFLRCTFIGPEDGEKMKVLLERWKERLETVDEQIPERTMGVCGPAEVESWLRSSDFHPFPTSLFGVRIGLAVVGDEGVSNSLKKGSPYSR